MDNDLKEIIPAKINEPINNIVDVITTNPKKKDYKLMTLWVIVGILAVLLLYYAYKMIYLYF
ncbi:hypothetical protein [Clostridium sp. CF012]|uniref:hypothetical protein n=1 Tax=Clostridium sp. CF012 TaxID=2843319 RepID=UPI001C0E784C|nr:hypothetical protein [Clostridium sp. CF012]MBU3142150.1 hypothetical protein [Clostridium sp. CF012]